MSKNTRTTNATKIPALPSAPNKVDPQLKKFLDSMVEAIEIRLGRRGDPRDRAITLRELISSGLAKELATNPYDPNANDFTVPGGSDVNLSVTVGKPTGLTAVGGFSAILVQSDLWKHRDHNRMYIYRHTSDDRANSILVGSSTSRFFSDQDVTSGTTYYYWARHENTHGDLSEWNAEAGTSATVQQDVDFLLTTLTGEIRNSHLFTTLATDVGRIPGWHTIIGSYDPASARTLIQLNDGLTQTIASTTTNTSDIGTNSSAISVNNTAITGLKSSIYVNGDPSQGLSLATASALTSLTANVTTNTNNVSGNTSNITSNSSAITQLNGDVYDGSGNVKLATVSAVSGLSASITTNSNNISGNTTSIATNVNDITALETTVNHPTTGVAATANSLSGLQSTVTTQGNSITANASNVTALEAVVFDGTGNTPGDLALATASALSTTNATVSTQGTAITATADDVTALETTIGGHTSTIAVHTSSINGIEAEYVVRTAIGSSGNRRVSGFGLMANATTTDFGILADKFFIEAPTGTSVTTPAVTPFSVVTSAQTFTKADGSTVTLPSGVYMDGAKIKFGSITEAHIGTATIDNAHITETLNANKIVAGTLDASLLNLDNASIWAENEVIKIKDLGVNTAHINNANVTTLKIAGEAATVPYGLAGTGGVTVGQNAGSTVTNWTDISGGGVSINYNTSGGLTPQKVSLVLTTQMLCSSSTSSNVVSMIFRIYDGANWLEEGHVGFGAMDDQSFTFTSGATFTPNGAGTTSGGSVIIKVYARKTHNTSTFTTGSSHLMVIGTRR